MVKSELAECEGKQLLFKNLFQTDMYMNLYAAYVAQI